MAVSVGFLVLAMGLLVAIEVVSIGLASGVAISLPYLVFTLALGSSSLAVVPTGVVYGGLALAAGCAVRVVRSEPAPTETAIEVAAVTYLLVMLSSIVATGYLLVSVLGGSLRAAILVCGVLVAAVVVSWLLYAAVDWSNADETERSGYSVHEPTTAAADEPVGITTEMRSVLEGIGELTDRPASGYFGVTLAGVVVLGLCFAAATVVPTVYHLPGLAAVGSLCIVGLHIGTTVRSEYAGESAVLRDLERGERRESRATATTRADDHDLATLQATVGRLAAQADVPTPTVRIGSSATPRAITVGYRPATSTVVVSRGLLETLDDRELEAVLAHELAHVVHRDAAVMTFLALPAANASATVDRHVANPVLAIPAAVTYAVSRWCVALVSSYREYVADDGAVAITGGPAALASALETLDAELERRPATDLRDHRSTAAFSIVPPPWEEHRFFDRTRRVIARGIFGTHPDTETRIDRLRTAVDGRD